MINIWTTVRRWPYRLISALIVLVLFDLLPPIVSFTQYRLFNYFYVGAVLWSGLVMGVSAAVGAYIAKVRFALPSLLLAVLWWSFTVWLLNSIAVAAGQGDLRTVAATNVFGFAFAVVGAIIGSLMGERLAAQRVGTVANAA